MNIITATQARKKLYQLFGDVHTRILYDGKLYELVVVGESEKGVIPMMVEPIEGMRIPPMQRPVTRKARWADEQSDNMDKLMVDGKVSFVSQMNRCPKCNQYVCEHQ